MKKVFIFIFFAFSVLFSCQQKTYLKNITLYDLAGESIKLDSLLDPNCTVVIFFSPECPLSENYTLTAGQLHEKYILDSITFLAVISGESYTLEEIRIFKNKYHLPFPIYLDSEKVLSKSMGASITPECFVLNKNKTLKYHGAIDNWAVDLGKKRTLITEHYLEDAIQSILLEKPLKISFVEAVGCYIE